MNVIRRDKITPSTAAWAMFVADNYGGNQDAALADAGWSVFPDGSYSFTVPEDRCRRAYTVAVLPGKPRRYHMPDLPDTAYTIEDNFGSDSVADNLDHALAIADTWRIEDIADRQREEAEIGQRYDSANQTQNDHGSCDLVPF